MDLPYPSQKDEQLNGQLSSARKPSLILRDSLNNIPPSPPLSPALKRRVVSLLKDDLAFELRDIMDREVISMTAEVGKEGSEENILHASCRQNAVKCVEYLLKAYYRYFPAEFEWWANRGSKEKVTPLMLCVLNNSNDCLQLLLQVGGIDIHVIDSNKLSAYNLALNSKNETAIKLLLQYEGKPKRNQLVNREFLTQQIELFPGKFTLCQTFYRCLIDCFTCGYDNQKEKDRINPRKRTPSFLESVGAQIEGYFVDKVELGLSKDCLSDNEIQWKLMGEYQQKGLMGVLFDTFSPFDIEDIAHPNENLLIVLQSLSQHPWLVKRIIQADKGKSGHFSITIHPRHNPKVITTDSYLPIESNTGQPVFVADKKEGWPMLIQKALAKHQGSYVGLNEVGPGDLIETLTGWPVVRRQIAGGFQAMQLMQRLNSEGFMYVLEGRPNSHLSCPAKPNCCFTPLTFYSKGTKRMVLINCPFVDPAWVEKEKHQILALKILRGHYNCRQQMTIWVEEDRLKQYFSSMLIAPIKSGYNRNSLHVAVNGCLYFRVEIQKNHEEAPIFYLIDESSSNLVGIEKIEGWKGDKEKVEFLPPELCQEQMASFEGSKGEYLFRVKVSKGRYLLVGWATEDIRIEPVEECFGEIEWVGSLRKNIPASWKDQTQSKVINTGEYTLFMRKREGGWVEGSEAAEVIEGSRDEEGRVRMVDCEDYCYCVLKGDLPDATISEE